MTSTTPPFQKSLDAVKSFLIFLGSYILAVCDIPALEFPSSSQKSSSKDKDIEGSGNGSRHEIAGLADVFNKEDEEEFDPEVASENLKPILLLFKDPVMEEMFVRTTLLSARIVILRSFSIVALSVVVATWSLYQLLPILLTTIGVLLIIIGLTSWKAGEVYVNIYTGSRRGRLALQLLEIIGVQLIFTRDIVVSTGVVMMPSLFTLVYYLLTIGITATTAERFFGMFASAIMIAIKCFFIVTSSSTNSSSVVLQYIQIQQLVMYLLPILAMLFICFRAAEKERRLKFLKTKFVENKLIKIRKHRERTDYLLSLSLPKAVWTKMREIGMSKTDRMSKRIQSATVMFADIINFKDLVEDLRSMRDSIFLLNEVFTKLVEVMEMYTDIEKIKTINTKVLFVGGLSNFEEHLKDMIDFAVYLQREFTTPMSFVLDGFQTEMSVSMSFGIEQGKISTGIVGNKKFVYEIYGDTVNCASRMLSIALSDHRKSQIVVTENVWNQVKSTFTATSLGDKYVKGKGMMRVFSIDGIVEDEAFQQQQRLNPLNADVEIKDVEDIQDLVLSSEDQMPMLVLKKPSVKRHHEPMDSSNPSFNPRSSVITTRTNNTRGRGGVRRQSLAIDFSDSEVAGSMVSMTNSSLVISAKKLPDVTIAGMQAGIGLNAQFAQFALLAAPDEVIDTVKTRTGLAKAKDSNDDKDKKVLKREYFSNIDEGDVEREAYLRKTANIQEFQEIERYLVRMNEEIDRFDLSFKFKLLEDKFRDDSCEATWSEFLKCNAEAWLCQVALLALALFSATANGSQVFGDFALFYDILWTTLFGIGLKLFMVALIAFHVASLGELGKQEANFKGRIAYNYLGVLTFLTTAIYISLSWSNLASYEYTNTYIIPQLLTLSCIRMEGVIFIYNVFAAFVVALVLLSIQLSFGVGTFIEYYSLVMFTFVWILIEFRKEKWARIEYLLDLILETQGRATKEEISKSADVLQSILPKRIITKLLMDKKNNIFEEFELITVLQLDIAGFTDMSSKLDPIYLVRTLNKLFTFFDHLTEINNVEKITTIGDAYVACSNLGENQDFELDAINVCLVALQMQLYIKDTLNKSALVQTAIGKPISVRIGIHSGPAHGAIVGGPKKFRYDILGDTVKIAEKVQEYCPIGQVSISDDTLQLVSDYHAFRFKTHDAIVNDAPTYVLEISDMRLLHIENALSTA